jgi:ABC-type sugar transport system substrate-binding protein
MVNRRQFTLGALIAAASASWSVGALTRSALGADGRTVALLFDSLQSPFWVSSNRILKEKIAGKGWEYLEAVSSLNDAKQFEQVKSMLARGVDGIVIIQTDANAVIPAIREANAANVPMVHFMRPPAASDAKSITIVADNRQLASDTANFIVEEGRRLGGGLKACILIGDLGDANSIERRDGFLEVVEAHPDIIEVVASIPTEWNPDKAFAGLNNALQAHPDINCLFTPSDFLHPQIEQALKIAGKWHRRDEPGHVLFAGFDGDEGAYQRLRDGYLDVCGVQNLFLGVDLAIAALEATWNGETPEATQMARGFVIDYKNLAARQEEMWGYHVFNQ